MELRRGAGRGNLKVISNSLKQAASFTRFPDKAFPMLWTSSYSGPTAWKNLGVDVLTSSAQKLIEATHAQIPWVKDPTFKYSSGEVVSGHELYTCGGKTMLSEHFVSAVPTGRISVLREYGGKLRCFAIPSTLTQYALKPIHDSIFRLLSKFPSDFTFDQNRFRRLVVSGFYRSLPA